MFEQSGIRGVIINSRISEVFRKKIFCLQKAVKKASNRGGRQLNALLSKLETGPRYRFNIISISISYSFVSFFRGFAFLTRVYVEYSLQNRFVFFISLFGLSAILKIRNGEHVHYVGLLVAYTWNRDVRRAGERVWYVSWFVGFFPQLKREFEVIALRSGTESGAVWPLYVVVARIFDACILVTIRSLFTVICRLGQQIWRR